MAKDINELIEESLLANWDSSSISATEIETEKAGNSIQYLTGPQFRAMSPWPRQIEFALNLFEDYCPDCSDMTVVDNCWGKSLDVIKSKVMILNFGVCPNCNKNRNDFVKEETHFRKQELIGIAGQRCLDPETKVRLANNIVVSIQDLRTGDLIQDRLKCLTKVMKVWTNYQPGYFDLTIKSPTNVIIKLRCSDQHTWVTKRGEICTAELALGELIEFESAWAPTWAELVDISKYEIAIGLTDIETSTGTFQHESGLTLHNSGKTFLTAELSAYVLHKYLCLEGVPCARYGLINTLLMGTFVAADRTQVSETTWGNFASAIQASPWFKIYFAMLKDEEKKSGVELFKFRPEGYLAFFHKKILFSHATSDQASLRGRTRIVGSVDELGWFDSKEAAKRKAGKEVYRSLDNSLRTIRSYALKKWKEGFFDMPTAYMFNVSSPSAEDDPIMSLAAGARGSKKSYIFHLPTWEICPDITLESLEDEIRKDPVGTMRDFGALPGAGKNVMFPNQDIIYALIDDNLKNSVISHKDIIQVDVKDLSYNYVKCILDSVKLDRSIPYMLSCDAGESNNSFSLMLSSLEEDVMVVNGAIVIQPESLPKGKVATVHFPSVVDFIVELRRFISLEIVAFDRWQSTLVIQGLRDIGVDARKYSLRYEDFKTFKQRVHEEKIKIPKPEIPFERLILQRLYDYQPIALLIKQLRTVRDTGRKIVKPPTDDDDVFRCLVLAEYFISQNRDKFSRRGIHSGIQSEGKVMHGNLYTVRSGINPGLRNEKNSIVFMQKGKLK